MIKISTLRYLARLFLSLLAQAIVFFAAANQLELPRAWLFFALAFLYYLLSFIILYRFNPNLIQHRGGSAFREDSKQWDKYILLIYALLGVYGQFFVAGWDLGHVQWFYLGWEYLVVGIILFIISDVLIVWAMVQNPFFEPTVRIQKERNQRVISNGPYRIVRHPGYLSGILWHLAMPLIFGSGLTLVYSLLIVVLLVVRTYLEDKTLQAELEGYQGYTRKTRHRLLPGVW
jgi:protein-S-isoprenylcysteine O-methyltransferase Ste14